MLLWSWITPYIRFPRLARRSDNKTTKPAQNTLSTFENQRLINLTSTLTDFQKTQCFFVSAINIAALTNKINDELLPINLQQLYDNYLLLASMAISGCLSITATLLTLHMINMISEYLLTLSECTVTLSLTSIAISGIFKPSKKNWNNIYTQAVRKKPFECDSVDLVAYCLFYQDTTYVWGIMAYCLIVLIYIIAYYNNAFKNPSTKKVRPWILRMISMRALQFVLSIILLLISLVLSDTISSSFSPYYLNIHADTALSEVQYDFAMISLTLSAWTITYVVFLSISCLRYAKKIRSIKILRTQLNCDLLTCVFWCVSFASKLKFLRFAPTDLKPLRFFIWLICSYLKIGFHYE